MHLDDLRQALERIRPLNEVEGSGTVLLILLGVVFITASIRSSVNVGGETATDYLSLAKWLLRYV